MAMHQAVTPDMPYSINLSEAKEALKKAKAERGETKRQSAALVAIAYALIHIAERIR